MTSTCIDEGPAPASDCCPTCRRPWPVLDRIMALYEQEVPTEEIAAELGLTSRRVAQVLGATGVKLPRGRRPKLRTAG